MPIGVMTGMRTEAAIAARLLGADDHLVVTGGRAARAAALAAMLIEKRCGHVVSFGIAGGLDPHLPPGAIVLADAVLDGGARYACDAAWTG
ncbi:MAG: hypothetical protein FJX52_04815, partial [Alphaproteobacteria bacterium]|nr:hypothetical protein [Alphaproteobacteria bacterium]